MMLRLARWIACALLVCLAAEPLPFLNFGAASSMSGDCCKDKQACCCRRSHVHALGPVLTAGAPCGSSCPIAVRNTKVVAAISPPAAIQAAAAPSTGSVSEQLAGFARSHHDAFLYQRPPPAES
jgi:hypothetical protein